DKFFSGPGMPEPRACRISPRIFPLHLRDVPDGFPSLSAVDLAPYIPILLRFFPGSSGSQSRLASELSRAPFASPIITRRYDAARQYIPGEKMCPLSASHPE